MGMTFMNQCSFCCKAILLVSDSAVDSSTQIPILELFIKIIPRYLSPNLSSLPASGLLKSCESCLKVIESFCNIYHEMKCLELQLEGRLQQLKTVMQTADQSKLTNPKGNDFEAITAFRNVLQLTCDAKLSKRLPRVVSKPLVKSEQTSQEGQPQENLSKFVDFGVGWMLSFVAVSILGINVFGNTPNLQANLDELEIEKHVGIPDIPYGMPLARGLQDVVFMKPQQNICASTDNTTAAAPQLMNRDMDVEQCPNSKSLIPFPYWGTCKYCTKTFRERKTLRLHKNACGKLFRRMNPDGYAIRKSKYQEFNLKYIKVMVNKDFGCVLCPFTAYQRETVRLHVTESHRDKIRNEQITDADTACLVKHK